MADYRDIKGFTYPDDVVCLFITNTTFLEKIKLIYYFFINKSYFCIFMNKREIGKWLKASVVDTKTNGDFK